MISCRSDFFQRFKEKNTDEVVGIASLAYKPTGPAQTRFITEFSLDIKTADNGLRKKVVDFFDDIYEGLPTVIRDSYQQSPSGYTHMYGGTDFVLTMVKEPGNPNAPFPEFIVQNITQRFANRGIENDMRGPAAINSGTPAQFMLCGEWNIKKSHLQ